MNDTRINYNFKFFNKSNALIDKIDGPGDFGLWFTGPESPAEMVILPVYESMAKKYLVNKEWYRVEQTPLNEAMEEVKEQASEAIAMAHLSEEEARELAQKLNCELYFWITWDGERYFEAVDLKTGEKIGWHQG